MKMHNSDQSFKMFSLPIVEKCKSNSHNAMEQDSMMLLLCKSQTLGEDIQLQGDHKGSSPKIKDTHLLYFSSIIKEKVGRVERGPGKVF